MSGIILDSPAATWLFPFVDITFRVENVLPREILSSICATRPYDHRFSKHDIVGNEVLFVYVLWSPICIGPRSYDLAQKISVRFPTE